MNCPCREYDFTYYTPRQYLFIGLNIIWHIHSKMHYTHTLTHTFMTSALQLVFRLSCESNSYQSNCIFKTLPLAFMLHCIVLVFKIYLFIYYCVGALVLYHMNQNNNITSSYLYTCLDLICLNPSVPNLIINKTDQPLTPSIPATLLSLSLSLSTLKQTHLKVPLLCQNVFCTWQRLKKKKLPSTQKCRDHRQKAHIVQAWTAHAT